MRSDIRFLQMDGRDVGHAGCDALSVLSDQHSGAPLCLRSSTSIAEAWRASAWVGAFVLPLVMLGMIEASMTLRRSTPRTLNLASTTARSSLPIRHVPTGWNMVVTALFTHSPISASDWICGPG